MQHAPLTVLTLLLLISAADCVSFPECQSECHKLGRKCKSAHYRYASGICHIKQGRILFWVCSIYQFDHLCWSFSKDRSFRYILNEIMCMCSYFYIEHFVLLLDLKDDYIPAALAVGIWPQVRRSVDPSSSVWHTLLPLPSVP